MTEVSTVPDPSLPATAGSPWRTRMEVLILAGILVLWIILQVWVLPKAGVPT